MAAGTTTGTGAQEYEVLKIDDKPDRWRPWEISVRWADGREDTHCPAWDYERDRVIAQPPAPDVTIVSNKRLHDAEESEYADILSRATIALDLRFHFKDPHFSAELRELTSSDQVVRDTVMDPPGVRELLAACRERKIVSMSSCGNVGIRA
ncbi:hypothetical protein ABZ250_35170 [Streptomyces afghaniensis]|uniref:hypothetical protein n=1 Tax=Streptomyces afghaniensis TaxID=66865 RepID=UPI0033B85F98